MIKTVTTTTGVNTVTFPEFFKYFWIKNIGDTTVYASAFANVSAGVDNTSVIKSGDTVCVENIDNDNVYISGEGSVEIHAQNYADCPFKVGVKGGEIPDLSEYAKTADVPNIKVNSAVDADTVGGKEPEKIFFDNGLTSDLDSATKSGCYAASPDTLNAPLSSWWVVDTVNFDNQFIVQKAHAIGNTANTVSYIRNYANGAWSDWTEIYAAGNKPYVTGVVTISGANDTDNLFRIETNHGFAPSWALCCNIADNIVYCCALSSDNPTRFIYLRSTEAIKNGDIFEYIIFR